MAHDVKSQLTTLLQQALASVAPTATETPIQLERPRDPTHGDWSTNLAMQLAKALKANPRQLAEQLVAALQATPARVELAQNQTVGPVYSVNSRTQRWERNRVKPTMACRKGQIAVFMVPHIPHDVQAEVGKPPPDGPDARFLPSQWMFRHCENGPAIALEPAR